MFGDVSHLRTQGKYNDGTIQKDQGNIFPAMALRNLTLLHRRWSAIKPLGYRYQTNQQYAQFFVHSGFKGNKVTVRNHKSSGVFALFMPCLFDIQRGNQAIPSCNAVLYQS
ncbi:hypothetical protein XFPR_01045 [Xylella fastidiosa]|uniref:Uncharacterized protein n=1 Tax=Xylella fastidiosa TaxID=2371 RepID=A0ABC8AB83_XYLFS|nr:hypothetical protein [Xylella fastidiosa]ALQ93963.1 hypothetical protein XFUD_01050 [Xylella fastidiosa]ALQ96211.1 hypothetical protein XFC3_01050 [Xylella fastidiosa]ALR01061.1 hypothetical protein OY18_01045 [Xylella fastidiosa]ALR03441.1 hypothetical protein XFPR_01045 [Xylella fastidiosa]ALR05669.1 hypothetical protein XFHB_01010 [Xylella fastidiosa]